LAVAKLANLASTALNAMIAALVPEEELVTKLLALVLATLMLRMVIGPAPTVTNVFLVSWAPTANEKL
jgi:hypothetical protein